MVTHVVRFMGAAFICLSSIATGQADTTSVGQRVVHKTFNASARKVDVDMSVATIRVVSDSTSAITATVTRRCTGSLSSGDTSWLNGSGLVLEQVGETVQVRDHPPSGDNDVNNNEGHRKQDIVLHLPPSVSLELNDGMGTVNVSGPIRSFKGNVGLGTASLLDAGVAGNPVAAKFNLGAGKITAIWSRPVVGSIDLNTGMGALYVRLSEQQKATVDASSGMGHVDVNFPGADVDRADETISASTTARLNGGGAPIKLSSGVGQVTLGVSK